MIPVHASQDDRGIDLAALFVGELDGVERGLTVLSRGLALERGVILDGLAEDVDGRLVLILIESGDGEQLFQRAADVLIAFQKAAPLLARAFPSEAFEHRDGPRLMLAARRFDERTEARLKLLRVAQLVCVECIIVPSATGNRVMVTAKSVMHAEPQARRLHLKARLPDAGLKRAAPAARPRASHSEAAANGAGNGSSNGSAHAPQTLELFAPPRPAASRPAPSARPAAPVRNGSGPRRALYEEIQQRLLRLSQDVCEEADGDLVRFHVGGQLLASLQREGDRVLLTAGGDGAEIHPVTSTADLGSALDAVFERFFNLGSTRRRLQNVEPRARGNVGNGAKA